MLLERLREFRIVRGSVVFYVLSWCSMLSCAFVFIWPALWGHLDRFIRVLDTPSFTLVLLDVRCPLCQAASPGFKDTLRAPIILLYHSVLQCACRCPLYVVTQNDVQWAVAATLAVILKAGVAGPSSVEPFCSERFDQWLMGPRRRGPQSNRLLPFTGM